MFDKITLAVGSSKNPMQLPTAPEERHDPGLIDSPGRRSIRLVWLPGGVEYHDEVVSFLSLEWRPVVPGKFTTEES